MSVNYGVTKKPLRDALLDLMSDLQWHSWADIRRVAGVRYGARLHELKRLGYEVETAELADGKMYKLLSLTPGAPQVKKVKVYLTEAQASSIVAGIVTSDASREVRNALFSFRTNKEKL